SIEDELQEDSIEDELQEDSIEDELYYDELYVENKKNNFSILKILGLEFIKFVFIFSTILFSGIIFINFNVFYSSIKEKFFSYDVYAKDINLNSVNEFSSISLNNFNKNGNKNNNILENNDSLQKNNEDTKNNVDKKELYLGIIDDSLKKVSFKSNYNLNEKKLETFLLASSVDYEMSYNLLPPDNRIIIPSIGIDAPIVDTKYIIPEKMAEGDFDDELYEGVVKYPFTADPGNEGNTMIFGHTSYYWWKKNPFGEVFARLPRLDDGDKVQIIWNGILYEYEIFSKVIKRPKDVPDEYKKYSSGGKYLSLMGCYPIGSDAQRIIVTAKQIENKRNTDLLN
ncbi:sortase, partial [Candidatus Vampirococcus lugosii]